MLGSHGGGGSRGRGDRRRGFRGGAASLWWGTAGIAEIWRRRGVEKGIEEVERDGIQRGCVCAWVGRVCIVGGARGSVGRGWVCAEGGH